MGWSWAGALSGIDKMQAKALKEEELGNEREKSLLGLYLSKLEKQSTAKTGDKYRNAAQSAMKLQKRVSQADLDEEDLAFFNNIIEDPFAAEEVLTFLDNNVTATGVPIPLSDVKPMLNIVNSNMPEADKIDYMSLITGADLSDSTKYYELAQQISSITAAPGRTVLTDVKPEARIVPKTQDELFKRQLEVVSGNLLRNAKREIKDNNADSSIQRVKDLMSAVQMVESGNTNQMKFGIDALMETYLNATTFKENYIDAYPELFKGWEKNWYLPQSLKAIQEPELSGNNNNIRMIPNATVLTQEMIDSNPSLKNVGAQPGDQLLQTTEGGKLYGPDGNPKR